MLGEGKPVCRLVGFQGKLWNGGEWSRKAIGNKVQSDVSKCRGF